MAVAGREAQAGSLPLPGAGFLVVLEGIDGSGKSTLAAALAARLQREGFDPVLTREPSDTWLGDAVRRSIRAHGDPFVDAFLFLADHAEHVRQIGAWIAAGRIVVSDRYGDSCLAYQGATLEPLLAARGERALDWLARAQAPVTRVPDVALLLDVDPHVAVQRIAGRSEKAKFEEAQFLERVRRNYLTLAKERAHYTVLDARLPAEELFQRAWEPIAKRAGL